MRSRYSLAFPSGREGETVLFSTKTAAAVLLPERLLGGAGGDGLTPEEERQLVSLGLLVPDLEEERMEVLAFARDLERQATTDHLIVIVTKACNLACPYCYQGPTKGTARLSTEAAARIVRFAEERTFERRRDLAVTFYGGEPLLALDRILTLAETLRERAAVAARTFRFSLITNGTLLTREAVSAMRPLGLRSVLVTLDGPAAAHDCLRPQRGGGGSFQRIVGNLREIWDLVDLQINVNYSAESCAECPRLLDELLAAGLGPSRIGTVNFSPITRERRAPAFAGGCRSLSEPWIIEAAPLLRGEALRRGYRVDRVQPAVCMVDLEHELVVDCDGWLYKCPCFAGEEAYRVGRLESPVHGTEVYGHGRWHNEGCLACPYLPLCFGGCRHQAREVEGTPRALECRRPFFEACLARLVRQDLALPMAAALPCKGRDSRQGAHRVSSAVAAGFLT